MTARARRRPLRLGIFGGTFNPVHSGHLLLARDALEQARLDAILFIPCAQNPLKKARPQATDEQRLAMLRKALKGEPRFWLSRCDLERRSPSYAIETMQELADAFPKAELFWLIGADQLADLPKWHRWEELRLMARFILLQRGKETLEEKGWPVLSLPRPRRIDISATEIRHRVKSRLSIDHLLPASVAAYIQRQGLYL